MSTSKLQKLLYYSKAWSLVWDGAPLFKDRIEAWMNGPVVVNVFHEHRGRYEIGSCDINGNSSSLSKDQKKSVDAVLEAYAGLSGSDLAGVTHGEAPWINARKGLAPGDRENREITDAAMYNYYSAL